MDDSSDNSSGKIVLIRDSSFEQSMNNKIIPEINIDKVLLQKESNGPSNVVHLDPRGTFNKFSKNEKSDVKSSVELTKLNKVDNSPSKVEHLEVSCEKSREATPGINMTLQAIIQKAKGNEIVIDIDDISHISKKVDKDEDEVIDYENDPRCFFTHDKWHVFAKRSVFMFTNKNKFRQMVVKMITHKRFDQFIVTLIILNSILLGIRDYTDYDNLSNRNKVIEKTDKVFVVFFALECISKVIGMGFILEDNSYLRDSWNWLDFIVVVSSLLTEIPQLQSVSGMRTFRLMRPLRSLTTMPSMKILISTLLASIAQLGGVMVLAIFFFTIFAILGVSLWKGAVFYRCRLTQYPVNGDWLADPVDTRLCSDVRQCPDQRWCGSLVEASRSSDPRYKLNDGIDLWRDTSIEDLNFGFSNFNHLGSAFLTIFQCITLEGWIDVTHIFEDSYDQNFVNFYFLLVIVVCSFFIMNLTIAVMLLKYEEFDKTEKSSSHVQDLYEYAEQVGLPLKFIDFVMDQDNLNICEGGTKMIEKIEKKENIWKAMMESTVTVDNTDPYYSYWITRSNFYIVNSPIFNGFIMFVIMLNTIVLSLDQYPGVDKETTKLLSDINLFFTIVFTLEVILKLIGLGVKGYAADNFNLFDAFIVIISIAEMFISEGGPLSALRAFRLFRIFKIFKAGDLRTLLDSIAFTIVTIKDYTVLLSLFIYVFSLLGMSFFAGKVKFNDDGQNDLNGQPPRINFDTVGIAALTVFEVMIGENWNSIMYDHMRGVGEGACIYFIMLTILGNIIMLNLFLAILLGNFERARSFGVKKKIFDSFSRILKAGYQLNVSITILFGDAEFTRYIEEKILTPDDDELMNKSIQESKKSDAQLDDEEEHKEFEIQQVYQAMTLGTIQEILSGNTKLVQQDSKIFTQDIPEQQRIRTVQILSYIKRQTRLRKQRQQFQTLLHQTQAFRQEMEHEFQEEQKDDQGQDQFLSSESNEDEEYELSFVENIIEHFQNSSLLIFKQDGFIRQCCLQCMSTEDNDKVETVKSNQKTLQPSSVLKNEGNTNTSPKDQQEEQNNRRLKSIPDFQRYKDQLKVLSVDQSSQDQQNIGGMLRSMTISQVQIKQIKATKKINVAAKIFDAIILGLILVSSVTLVMTTPLSNPESPDTILLGYLDNCFTVVFTLEALIKIIANGFMFNNETLRKKGMIPYIRNPWNMLDFVVVVSSLIDFIVTINNPFVKLDSEIAYDELPENAAQGSSSLQSLKALRALRALRPLRMVSRNKGMKLIVNALLSSLPAMSNVTIVCLLFLLIFAILGVGFFKGSFGRCSITDPVILQTILTKTDCLNADGTWDVPAATFDNTLEATRTLFEMMTTEGWIDNMSSGVDMVPMGPEKIPMQPQEGTNDYYILYFVSFMILGSQFILNLFVGVIMDNFNKIKEKEEMGSLFVTEDQRTWIDAQRLGLALGLQKKIMKPPGWRLKYYKFISHSAFDSFITFFIAFNTLVMAAQYDGIDPDLKKAFGILNYIFAFIFQMEMIFKLIGLGWQYFYSAWNKFDCMVVIGTDIGIILKFFTSGSGFSTAATVIRAFRIMRIVRLIRSYPNIKIILDTLIKILPQISNFIALMILILFIYAALGMNLFSGVVYQDFINDKNNFKAVGGSMIYLFRSSTGEDWNKIMHEFSNTHQTVDCIDDQDYDTFVKNGREVRGCGNSFAQVYFMSFVITFSWLIMNLAVAAVIEGLENAQTESVGVIQSDHVEILSELWQEYDTQGTGWIDTNDFICLLTELPEPFGSKKLQKLKLSEKQFQQMKTSIYNKESYYINEDKKILIKNKQIMQILQQFKLTTYMPHNQYQNIKLHFKDIYSMFVMRIFQEEIEDFQVSEHIESKYTNEWKSQYKKTLVHKQTEFLVDQQFANRVIARYVQAFRERKAIRDQAKEDKKKGLERSDQRVAEKSSIKMKSKGTDSERDIIEQLVLPAEQNNRQSPGSSSSKNGVNFDANPQEFEDDEEEVRSEERGIQLLRGNRLEENKVNDESMTSEQENLPQLKMDQSITVSHHSRASSINHNHVQDYEENDSRDKKGDIEREGIKEAVAKGIQPVGSREDLRKTIDGGGQRFDFQPKADPSPTDKHHSVLQARLGEDMDDAQIEPKGNSYF